MFASIHLSLGQHPESHILAQNPSILYYLSGIVANYSDGYKNYADKRKQSIQLVLMIIQTVESHEKEENRITS